MGQLQIVRRRGTRRPAENAHLEPEPVPERTARAAAATDEPYADLLARIDEVTAQP